MMCLLSLIICVFSCGIVLCSFVFFFFFQAEDGIRDLVRSRGLGDVYKRQVCWLFIRDFVNYLVRTSVGRCPVSPPEKIRPRLALSLIHI